MKNLQYFLLSLIINLFIFSGVTSLPTNLTETSKGFKVPCPTVEFFRDSIYTKSCFQESESLLCTALYDLGLKWCTKSSQHISLPEFTNAIEFDKFVSKYDNVTYVNNFCRVPKKITDEKSKMKLQLFYNDSVTCAQNCLNFAMKNKEPLKLCSALTSLEAEMNLSDEKSAKFKSVNIETKPEELNKPDAKVEKIVEKEGKDKKQVSSVSEIKESTLKDTSKSVNNVATKDENKPQNPKQQKEKSSKKEEEVPGQKEPLETDTKNEQNKKDDKLPNLKDNPDSKKIPMQNVQENPESTGNKPDAEIPNENHKSETDGTKTDKTESGKKGKTVSNNDEINSSTISEHTDDAAFSDDVEAPPYSKCNFYFSKSHTINEFY